MTEKVAAKKTGTRFNPRENREHALQALHVLAQAAKVIANYHLDPPLKSALCLSKSAVLQYREMDEVYQSASALADDTRGVFERALSSTDAVTSIHDLEFNRRDNENWDIDCVEVVASMYTKIAKHLAERN